MPSNRKKSNVFNILSAIALFPNFLGLLVACFFLDTPNTLLYIVPGTMVVLSIVVLIYGIYLRKKS